MSTMSILSLHSINKDTNRIKTHLETINSDPNVVYASETQFTCLCCWKAFDYCPSAPHFDTTSVTDHRSLIYSLDRGLGGGKEELEKKFTELHDKLKRKHLNPFYWAIPALLICLICILIFTVLEGFHQVQCRSSNVCKAPTTQDFGFKGECPTTMADTSDCCIAFCYRLLENSTSWGDQGCFQDPTMEEKIQTNTPLDEQCQCRPCNHCGKHRKVYCGKLKYFGDFEDLPGSYASPNIAGVIKPIFTMIGFIVLLIWFFYAWFKSRKVGPIVQEIFSDFKDKGIDVHYQPTVNLGKNRKQKGCIVFTLPSTLSDPAMFSTEIE